MAAAYRVVVSSVSCYNSVVVDRRTHSHAVHYCSGPCRALSQGLDCSVAHHGTCSELLATPDSPYPDLNGLSGHSRCMTTQQIPHHGKTNGTIDTGYNCAALERAGSNGNLFIGEESNMWRGKKFPTGGGSTGNLSCSTYGSLKDITEEAINLASGKLKEFSFDKLRLSSSSHVTFRKGRKVRPDSFSRRSTDLEIIYGHFGSNVSSNGTTSSTAAAPNDENAPPLFEMKQKGSSSSSSVVTKVNGSSGSGSLDQSMNTLASLYRNTLGDENLIARLLEKTWGEAAAGGAGGEDIRACLDILLKCSEDLKKCTDIIKQCIRRKGGGGPQDGGASPDSVYRALMTRLSMYLKRLPLELEGLGNGGQGGQGTPGSGHGDLMELVNSLHSLQQTPFSPIFGSEQPPRYEDVVQSPPNPKMTPNSASSTPHLSVQSAPSKALTNGLQHLQPPSSVTHHNLSPSPVTSSPSNRSPTNSPSRLRVSPTPPYSHTPPGSPMEALYIEEEDVDTGKMSEQITQNTSQNKDVSSKSVHISQPDSTGIVYNSTRPSPNALAHRNDDIDKLLMDLENLSQSMSNHRNTEPPLPVKTRKRGVSGLGIVSNEAQTQPKMSQFQVTTPASHLAMNGTGFKAPQGEKRNAGAGEEQEDGALLLRILESIESFAQELVDSGAGSAGSSERNSGKEREVMKLLQGTLASTGRPDTPVVSSTGQNAPAACPTETVPAVTVPAIPPKLSARTPSVTAALPRKTAAEEVCTVTSALLPPPEAASASPATPEAKDGLSEAPPIHPKTTSATVSLHSLAHPAQLGNDASPKVPPARSSPSVVVGRDLAVTIRDIPVLRDTGSTLLIQQTPEVIRVQSKAEKKPGTPPPAPAQASAVSHAPSRRSPSPPPAAPVIIIPSPPPPPAIHIPRFYYPCGLPAAGQPANHDAAIAAIEAAFAEFEEEKADIYEMSKVAKVCECPLYWKAAMFYGAGGERTGFVSVHSFVATWRKLLRGCHDDASRFIHLLAKPGCQYLEQEDFIPLLQDIVDTHPGLTFLKDAPEFHSRYITTVIQRIFYVVNRSWTGRVSMTELRRSNFLQTLALLEEEDDINQITDYFSYEHFYVIYCKFWELDSDHDLYIDHKDLARYNDHASSNRIIERLFSGAVTRGNAVQREGRMSYAEFVWFLISEEDKKNPTSIEYWFRCMDVDGDGVLSMFELEYFYEEQCERMERMGIEPLPFQDLLCQMLDLVKPESPGKMTLGDLKRCRMAHIFFDTFFNLEKYLDHEQRDPFAVHKDLDSDGPEPSDWDKYASEEYEILVAEETANEQIHEGSFEEDYDVDDLQVPAEIGNKIEKLVISDLTA